MLGGVIAAGEIVMREAALFAAAGFLLLGLGDVAVDLIWIGRTLKRRLPGRRRRAACAASLAPPAMPGRLAVFVPAWDEATVIANMLTHARAAFGEGDWRIYVGCYPNDPETIAAVRPLADDRIRLVVTAAPGPTSKADCLNRLWEAMRADEAAGIMYQMHQAPDRCNRPSRAMYRERWQTIISSPFTASFASAGS